MSGRDMTPEQCAAAFEDLARALSGDGGGPFSESQLYELGDLALMITLARTKRGIDADGRKFKPYSASYTKERKAAKLAANPVDLARTGHMLGALARYPDFPDQSVSLGFEAEAEADKAAAHNYGLEVPTGRSRRPRRMPVRRFLGFTPQERQVLAEAVGADLVDVVDATLRKHTR